MSCGEQANEEVAKSLQQMKSMLNGDGGKSLVLYLQTHMYIRRCGPCLGIKLVPSCMFICGDASGQ